jgi:hypothetical protein
MHGSQVFEQGIKILLGKNGKLEWCAICNLPQSGWKYLHMVCGQVVCLDTTAVRENA